METKEFIKKLKEHTNLTFREVDSSNIYLEAYHDHLGQLFLIFRNKNNDPKLIYAYKVNPVCYQSFKNAESKGRFFNDNIKPYQVDKYEINF